MYRLVLYYLVMLWVVALILSFFKVWSFTPVSMILSLAVILSVAWATNYIFSYVFKVPANVESIFITVFILALIINPANAPLEYIFLGWAAILSMSSKYIFAIRHKHIFNPAAFTMVVTSFLLNQGASWWVGTLSMLPFVLIGGILIVRKIKRTDLSLSFLTVALITSVLFTFLGSGNILNTIDKSLFYSPLLFFTFIMITEPLTTPPSSFLRILYGTFVGILFAPQMHIGGVYSSPELALVFGNIFSYLISPKQRLTLRLKKKEEIAYDTAEYVFELPRPFNFKPGQYLEWTMGLNKSDSRGNRRYFTIASSPTEKDLILGIKFYEKPSKFKMALAKMNKGDTIIASQLSGDFVLPKNQNEKLVFLAGGIGITPFRSMIKFIMDKGEKRDIVLIYSNKTEKDIAYKNIFDLAANFFDLKVVYVLTNPSDGWQGKKGRVDENMIKEEIGDYLDRTYYISGPPSMVFGTERTIRNLGVGLVRIKTDFFPGFA